MSKTCRELVQLTFFLNDNECVKFKEVEKIFGYVFPFCSINSYFQSLPNMTEFMNLVLILENLLVNSSGKFCGFSCIVELEKVDEFKERWNTRQKGFVRISTNMKTCFLIWEENLFQNM